MNHPIYLGGSAEAWRKRRYKAAFIAKLSDAEGEAAETQTWLEVSVRCGYVSREAAKKLYIEYDEIISMAVPALLQATTSLTLKTHLPVTQLPLIDTGKPTLIYN